MLDYIPWPYNRGKSLSSSKGCCPESCLCLSDLSCLWDFWSPAQQYLNCTAGLWTSYSSFPPQPHPAHQPSTKHTTTASRPPSQSPQTEGRKRGKSWSFRWEVHQQYTEAKSGTDLRAARLRNSSNTVKQKQRASQSQDHFKARFKVEIRVQKLWFFLFRVETTVELTSAKKVSILNSARPHVPL